MGKNAPPFNGPSKTGNPSGKGRGNNPPGGDDDSSDHYPGVDPGVGYEDRVAALFNRTIKEQADRHSARTAALNACGERQWMAATVEEVKAAAVENLAPYEIGDRHKRMALFIRTCKAELGEELAAQITERMAELCGVPLDRLRALAQRDSPLLDRTQTQLNLIDWTHYYDAQFEGYLDEYQATWEQCKALMGRASPSPVSAP
ncbi:hypothetical protein H8Z72_23195 (plasmid) [Xanthomonas citri pv. citri]|uniref:hypothetical protein n=1 Tax=Xanthomonas citri TaxID=346 RepID=UPI001933E0AC|nr:hypothetical protein [Xanthomonas citri]QRD62807.1 hypothetical protein H8Z74_22990 [Xanthomonas citri pv. citri]QRD67246.1 hypothetical protein H8Z73_23075 [Xanthomonas citri pv. citri]QRD71835.1 hypothetical protein H8Z72_23195 [Xanthomonas citri pv. citri]